MAETWVHSGSSICWQYEWMVKFAASTWTVSDFIGIQPLEVTKAFRIGMGINSQSSVIRLFSYINSLDLARLGFKVRAVSCCLQVKNSVQLKLIELQQVSNNESHLLFSWDMHPGLTSSFYEPCLTFQLHLTGTVDQYAVERFDTNFGLELGNAIHNKTMTDVCVKVGKEGSISLSFHAHKFVLAARSPVFRAMFNADMVESRTGRVEIPDVDPEIFRQFLHFLYTGTLMKPASKELGIVAEKYQVDSLNSLCREADAVEGTVREKLLALTDRMPKPYNFVDTFLDPQDGEVEILSVESFLVENVGQQLNRGSQSILEDTFLYRVDSITTPMGPSENQQVTFYCNRTNGLAWKITSVHLMIIKEDGRVRLQIAMTPRILFDAPDDQPLQVFTINASLCNPTASLRFIVYRASTVETFQYRLRDSLYAQQLWSSAVNKELADLEIQVNEKTFPAHAAILLARCPSAVQLQGARATVAVSSVETSRDHHGCIRLGRIAPLPLHGTDQKVPTG